MNTYLNAYQRHIKAIFVGLLSVLAVGAIVFGLMSQEAGATSCPLDPKDGRYIVNFNAILRADSTEAKASHEVTPFSAAATSTSCGSNCSGCGTATWRISAGCSSRDWNCWMSIGRRVYWFTGVIQELSFNFFNVRRYTIVLPLS